MTNSGAGRLAGRGDPCCANELLGTMRACRFGFAGRTCLRSGRPMRAVRIRPHATATGTEERHTDMALAGMGLSWSGFEAWRRESREDIAWGDEGSVRPTDPPTTSSPALAAPLAERARQVLLTPDPRSKALLSIRAFNAFREEVIAGCATIGRADAPDHPARPPLPRIVEARDVPRPRDMRGRMSLPAYMIHNCEQLRSAACVRACVRVLTIDRSILPSLLPSFLHLFVHT